MSFKKFLHVSSSAFVLTLAPPALATDFVISNGQTVGGQNISGTNDTITVNAGGAVTAIGAIGVFLSGTNTSATNNGQITTSGNNTSGIYNTSTGLISGNGSIITSGANSPGILNLSSGTVNYSGTIITTGTISNGITNFGTGNITHNGSITTSNNTSYGLYNSNNGIISGNGSITTSGDSSSGIYNLGSGEINYSGNITVTGDYAHGIVNNSGDITNSGIISASGLLAHGILNNNADSVINNGTITASGANSYGIYNSASGSTITNNGTVDTIYADASNITIILGSTSNVTESITYASTGGILQYTTGLSYASEGGGFATGTNAPSLPTIIGSYTANIIDNGSGAVPAGSVLVTSGGRTLAVTPDIFSGTDLVVSNTASQVGSILTQRQQYALLGNNIGIASGTQYASNTSSMSDVEPAAGGFTSEQSIGWAEGFGSYRERPLDGQTAFSRTRSGGILTGLDLPVSSQGYRSGFYVGGFGGEQILGKTKFRTIDSIGALAGGYIGKKFDSVYAALDISTGYANHDSDRKVGTDIANADYNSYFISPALTIIRPIAGNDVTWVPSVTVRYTGQYTEDYQESGSTADQDVDSTTSQSLSARAQVEAHIAPTSFSTGVLTHVARVGVEGETYLGNRTVDLTVLGSNVTLNPSGGDNTVNGIVGMNVSYDLHDGPELYFDGESSLGINKGGLRDNIGGTVRVGGRWQF